MEADAEHQEDHADLGELVGEAHVAAETGGVGADDDAGQQVPDGQYRLRVVYGEFDSREAALAAQRNLPPRYQEAFRTTARSFAELRSQI